MLFFVAAALALTPPLTAATILLATAFPPRLRSLLAFGSMILLSSAVLAVLGSASALLDGRQPVFPYWLVTGLPALTIGRIMYLELTGGWA